MQRTARSRGRGPGIVATALVALAAGALVAACSSPGSSSAANSSATTSGTTATGGGGSSAPGVTSTAVNVGAISTLTGAIAANFNGSVPGVKAYFDMVNAEGGINGRKINLAYNLDTGGNPTQFNQLAHTLVNQDHAFAAVGVASAFFSPNYFVATKTPTYGYNVTGNWTGPDNLFGAGGSIIDYTSEAAPVAYLVKQTHASTVGVVAYGVPASADACRAIVKGLGHDGVKVGYTDLNVQYPGSGVSADVQRMQQAGVNFVVSCMDVTGNITMSRAIAQYGLKTGQVWLNGNTQSTLDQYPTLMKGVYFEIQHVPFAADTTYYPGLAQYLEAMKKYEPAHVYDEVAVQGWESAALFVAGVKAAGKNLTQQGVVAATNKMTDFTAGGLITPVNWTTAHTHSTPPYCQAFIQVVGKTFVPRFGKGHQVFTCFGADFSPVPVSPGPGTPGT